jgi:uncharacterized protein (DUF1800 family)
MNAIKKSAFGYEQARHLLWRAGFGGPPSQIQLLASWGPERAVDYLINYESVNFEAVAMNRFDKDIMRPPTKEEQQLAQRARRAQDEDALAKIRSERMEREKKDREQMKSLQKWWFERMVSTPRPLEEKLTLFWHGHFATSYRTIEDSYHLFKQNQTLRQNAAGNFGKLLAAIIHDPAMLAYLNNNQSRKGKPNENLAREIMELFSLGIGSYSEQDIKEGARALTGYTYEDDDFVFHKNEHDDNAKSILGRSGKIDGDEFVRIILAQEACPRFIARKLYKHFVADIPPLDSADGDRNLDEFHKHAIADLAGELRRSNYELKPVLKRMFLSEHFYDERIVGQQIKSPVELVVGAIRSFNTPLRDQSLLLDVMDRMGQDIFYPPSVKGWDGGRSWINTSTLYVRQNTLTYLLTGKKPAGFDALAATEKFDSSAVLGELTKADPGAERDATKVAEYLLRLCLGAAPDDARSALVAFAAKSGEAVTPDVVTGMLLIITAMPEYQLC